MVWNSSIDTSTSLVLTREVVRGVAAVVAVVTVVGMGGRDSSALVASACSVPELLDLNRRVQRRIGASFVLSDAWRDLGAIRSDGRNRVRRGDIGSAICVAGMASICAAGCKRRGDEPLPIAL